MKQQIKQAIRQFGVTWRRWIVPITMGVLGIHSLWRLFTTDNPLVWQLYLILLLIALIVIVAFELWYHTSRKKSQAIDRGR